MDPNALSVWGLKVLCTTASLCRVDVRVGQARAETTRRTWPIADLARVPAPKSPLPAPAVVGSCALHVIFGPRLGVLNQPC